MQSLPESKYNVLSCSLICLQSWVRSGFPVFLCIPTPSTDSLTLPYYSVHSPSPPTLSTLLDCFQQPTNVITSVKNDKNLVHIYNFREVETEGPGRSQCWCQCYTECNPAWATLDSVSKNKTTISIIIETTKKNLDLSLPDYPFIPFHPLPFLLSFLC